MGEAYLFGNGGTGGNSKSLPVFQYTGEYLLEVDEEIPTNWKVKFLTSGTLTFLQINSAKYIDAFLVGGGGGGVNQAGTWSYGGSGANTLTVGTLTPKKGVPYEIVIGAGGSPNNDGSPTMFMGYTANGGAYGLMMIGNGQSMPTFEFYALDGDTTAQGYAGYGGLGGNTGAGIYGGGTGSGNYDIPWATNGQPNSGSGGGGSGNSGTTAASGGSGIVIIRNSRRVG